MITSKPIGQDIPQSHIHFQSMDGNLSSIEITPELLTTLGMKGWINTCYASMLPKSKKNILHEFIHDSVSVQNKMALTPMSNGFEGYGVVAIEVIPKGSKILYTGTFISQEDANPLDRYIAKIDLSSQYCLSSEEYGNITRFMNHAPHYKEVDKLLQFNSPEVQQTLLTANFYARKVNTSNEPLIVLEALRDIQIGEPLVWDYGMGYFHTLNFSPILFNHLGNVISPELYNWKNPQIYLKINNRQAIFYNELRPFIENGDIAHLSRIDLDLPYDIFIHSEFLIEKFQENPLISQSAVTTIELPTSPHPLIKYMRIHPDTSLKQLLYDQLNSILKPSTPIQSIRQIPARYPSVESRIYQKNYWDKFCLPESTFGPLEVLQAKLELEDIPCELHEHPKVGRTLTFRHLDLFKKLASFSPCISISKVSDHSFLQTSQEASHSIPATLTNNEDHSKPNTL